MTIEKPFGNVDELVVPKSDAPFKRTLTKICESQCQFHS
jgi:hypothetical protein